MMFSKSMTVRLLVTLALVTLVITSACTVTAVVEPNAAPDSISVSGLDSTLEEQPVARAANVPCYFEQPIQGVQKIVAGSGCEIEVQSGATFDLQSGATTDFSSGIDIDGASLVLDADGDSSVTADIDDRVDFAIGGSDVFSMTASSLFLNGNELVLDVDQDTSFASDIDDRIDIEIGGSDTYSMTASIFHLNGKQFDLDIDQDTSVTASTDDQIDFEISGADEFIFTAGILDIGNGTLGRIDLDDDNDTSIRSNIDDQIAFEISGSNRVLMTAAILDLAATFPMMIDLDEDNDTSLRSSVDDQLDIELGGADQVVLKAVAAADSATTNEYTEIAFSTPADTTGTNTHNALTIDVAIGNATGGTNAVTGIQIDAITDDPQVVEKAIVIGDEWDYAVDTVLPIMGTAMEWKDDFIGDAVLTPYTEINGSDAQAVQGIVEEQYGVYQITSGDAGTGNAADLEALYLSLEWQADQGSLVFETRLHLDTDALTTELCVGFTDDVTTAETPFTIAGGDAVTAVADDAVAFCFDTGADTDEWFALGVDSTTAATGNAATGTAPTGDTYQTLRIEVDDGGADCRFYIDGALVGTLTANCVTPTVLLAPGFVISSDGDTDSNVVDIDYIYVAAARD